MRPRMVMACRGPKSQARGSGIDRRIENQERDSSLRTLESGKTESDSLRIDQYPPPVDHLYWFYSLRCLEIQKLLEYVSKQLTLVDNIGI